MVIVMVVARVVVMFIVVATIGSVIFVSVVLTLSGSAVVIVRSSWKRRRLLGDCLGRQPKKTQCALTPCVRFVVPVSPALLLSMFALCLWDSSERDRNGAGHDGRVLVQNRRECQKHVRLQQCNPQQRAIQSTAVRIGKHKTHSGAVPIGRVRA